MADDQTPAAGDLRDQIADALNNASDRPDGERHPHDRHSEHQYHWLCLVCRGDVAALAAAAADRVAPLLAERDRQIEHIGENFARAAGRASRLAAERDRLSTLLRGMARRSSSWRRISYKRINRLLAATADLAAARDDAKNAREDSARRARENTRLRVEVERLRAEVAELHSRLDRASYEQARLEQPNLVHSTPADEAFRQHVLGPRAGELLRKEGP